MTRKITVEGPQQVFNSLVERKLLFPNYSKFTPEEWSNMDRFETDSSGFFEDSGTQILLEKFKALDLLDNEELHVTLQFRDRFNAEELTKKGAIELNGQLYRLKGSVILVEQPNSGIIDVKKHTPEGGPITQIEYPEGEVPNHLDVFTYGGNGLYISSDSLDLGPTILVEVLLVV